MADDWVCRTCQHLNFNWRKKCQRCKEPVLSRVRNCATGPRVHNVRPGDWFCDAGLCRAHNFANRQFCFRCGVIRRSVPSFGASVGYQYHNPPVSFDVACKRIASISRRGWTTGDWFCFSTECNAHNYGQRMRCYKCKSLRD